MGNGKCIRKAELVFQMVDVSIPTDWFSIIQIFVVSIYLKLELLLVSIKPVRPWRWENDYVLDWSCWLIKLEIYTLFQLKTCVRGQLALLEYQKITNFSFRKLHHWLLLCININMYSIKFSIWKGYKNGTL